MLTAYARSIILSASVCRLRLGVIMQKNRRNWGERRRKPSTQPVKLEIFRPGPAGPADCPYPQSTGERVEKKNPSFLSARGARGVY